MNLIYLLQGVRMMKRRVNFLFWRNKVLIAFYLLMFIFGLPASLGFSQELDKIQIDYDVIFEKGLKRNGKLLNLSGKKIGDEGMKRLVSSGALEKVEKIDLRYNEITASGAELFAKVAPLSKLRVLILRHNILGDAGAIALANSSSFPNLEEMQLGWTETRDAGAQAFGSTDKYQKLKKLDFRGNFLANKTKEGLKKSLGHLKSLKLF